MVLDGEEGLEVVGEAADIETALHRTRELRPQVVVLDLNMPGTPTLSAMDRFTALAPMSAVVVLTMEADPAMARAAFSAGAKAYVLKEGAETAFIDAVRSAAAGRTYLDPGLGARMALTAPRADTDLPTGSLPAATSIASCSEPAAQQLPLLPSPPLSPLQADSPLLLRLLSMLPDASPSPVRSIPACICRPCWSASPLPTPAWVATSSPPNPLRLWSRSRNPSVPRALAVRWLAHPTALLLLRHRPSR